MRKLIGIIAVLAALALPVSASAHSGTVTCNTTDVVFSYHADFPVTTVVHEKAGAVTKDFTVLAHTAATDSIPYVRAGGNDVIVASSTWVGGGTIPPTTLICLGVTPVPPVTPVPVPPVPNPPVCPAGTNSAGISNGVLVCVTPPPVVPPPFAICPKGDKSLGVKNGVLVCVQTKIKIVHKVTKIVKWVQWCPLPPKKTPGVTG